MTPFGRLVRDIEPHGLLSLGDQIITYQCHHHSLFLDQTVSDALRDLPNAFELVHERYQDDRRRKVKAS